MNRVIKTPKWKTAKVVSKVSKKTGGLITGRVKHVLLLDYWNGREAGEFLCGAQVRNQTAHRLFNLESRNLYLSNNSEVTCKKCIKLLNQIR